MAKFGLKLKYKIPYTFISLKSHLHCGICITSDMNVQNIEYLHSFVVFWQTNFMATEYNDKLIKFIFSVSIFYFLFYNTTEFIFTELW